MNVSVTGADGLLGSNLVRSLLEAGHSVTVLLQRGRNSGTLDGLPLNTFYGDILDPPSLEPLYTGADAVIHAAASVSVWPSRSQRSRLINITGTQNMVNAALKHTVSRFIYVGTANSFSPGTKEHPGNEQTPFVCGKYGLDYIDSKYEAQRIVLDAWEKQGLPALTINPTFMIGPYDSAPSSGQMLVGLSRGKIPGYTTGGKCFVHVCDVADAIVNALSRGQPGSSYIAGKENLSYREFFELAADILGVRPPSVPIPRAAAVFGGAVGSAVSLVTRKPPKLSYAMARIACDGHYYDSSRAREELGMTSRSISSAVKQSAAWMSDHHIM
jgi:dihydroflavonol-4-reductase